MNVHRGTLLFLAAVLGVLAALVFRPFLQFVLAAILLGYILYPFQRRGAVRLGPRVSAGALIVLATVVVVVPLGLLVLVVARQAAGVVRLVQQTGFDLAAAESFLHSALGVTVDLAGVLQSAGQTGTMGLLSNLLDLVGGLSVVASGLVVFYFVLYYLLKDGADLVAWLRRVTPLPADELDELAERLDRLLWAVFIVNVAVAGVQAVLTGIGLLAVGFPSAVFWAVLTFVLALLPLIGASVVWLPIGAYLLLLVDRPLAGAFILLYGTFVVSLSDNYLRPMVGGHEARLNPGLFVVGIFGGVAVLGFMGLFFGPVVVGAFKAVMEVLGREFASESG